MRTARSSPYGEGGFSVQGGLPGQRTPWDRDLLDRDPAPPRTEPKNPPPVDRQTPVKT